MFSSMVSRSKFVCNCRCVSKSEILYAIRRKGAKSYLDVIAITSATTGCGRCRIEVDSIVDAELKKVKIADQQLKLDFGD